jgi:hypothetical protein
MGCRSVTEYNLSSGEPTCLARSLVGRAEAVVYVIVAILLLIAAVVTCCFALVAAVQQFWSGKPLEGIFSFVNDLLLVLIICSYKDFAPTEHVSPFETFALFCSMQDSCPAATLLMHATTHSKQRSAQILEGAGMNEGLLLPTRANLELNPEASPVQVTRNNSFFL